MGNRPTSTTIYWLNGMAGTGKTTIECTFSQLLDKNQMLGATYFCCRLEDDTRNVDRIFPTIAHGLARRYPSVFHALVEALRKDPDAGCRSMINQFSDLIVTGVKAASIDLNVSSVVVIIDALDECSNQESLSLYQPFVLNSYITSENFLILILVHGAPYATIQNPYKILKARPTNTGTINAAASLTVRVLDTPPVTPAPGLVVAEVGAETVVFEEALLAEAPVREPEGVPEKDPTLADSWAKPTEGGCKRNTEYTFFKKVAPMIQPGPPDPIAAPRLRSKMPPTQRPSLSGEIAMSASAMAHVLPPKEIVTPSLVEHGYT